MCILIKVRRGLRSALKRVCACVMVGVSVNCSGCIVDGLRKRGPLLCWEGVGACGVRRRKFTLTVDRLVSGVGCGIITARDMV